MLISIPELLEMILFLIGEKFEISNRVNSAALGLLTLLKMKWHFSNRHNNAFFKKKLIGQTYLYFACELICFFINIG